jgi:NNP family nitrate/nitrite transporter-like MFS transporter
MAGGVGGFYLASSLGISKELTGSYHPGFLVFGLLAAAALLAVTGVKSRWRRTWGASHELGSARI